MCRFSSSEGDDPEPSCLTFTDKHDCLQHACGWCSSVVLADLKGCVSQSIVKLIPEALADCKLPKQHDDDDDDDDEDADDDVFFAQVCAAVTILYCALLAITQVVANLANTGIFCWVNRVEAKGELK